jgi:hypothetical protein
MATTNYMQNSHTFFSSSHGKESAAPQNLPDGMLAETVQHANHILSLPTGPANKIANSASKNEPVVIMP